MVARGGLPWPPLLAGLREAWRAVPGIGIPEPPGRPSVTVAAVSLAVALQQSRVRFGLRPQDSLSGRENGPFWRLGPGVGVCVPAQNRQNAEFGPIPAHGGLCQSPEAPAAGHVVRPPRLEVDPALTGWAVLDDHA